jgi:homoserine dehydrogenase
MGVTNAVTIDADAVKELTLIGPGAGGEATASAVIADIADVATGKARMPFGRPVHRLEKAERAPMQRHEGGYYVRLTVPDRPGAAAASRPVAEADISLESILQRSDEAVADRHGRSGRSRCPTRGGGAGDPPGLARRKTALGRRTASVIRIERE